MRSSISLLALAAAALIASSAQAQTVIGAGTPSFPIVISKSGSYQLAANLNVPAGSDGIAVASGINVTLDLRGFQITGAATCTKAGCSGGGQSTGIKVGNSVLRVLNGTVKGFPVYGIGLDPLAQAGAVIAEDLLITGNFNGIFIYQLTAHRVVAQNNAYFGMLGVQGLISASTATLNGGPGIYMGAGLVRDSRSMSNAIGFEHGSGVATGNMSASNAQGNKLGSIVQSANAFY